MNTDKHVILVGEDLRLDGGFAREAYGPFTTDDGKEIAARLDEGEWLGARWHAIPLGRLPGQRSYQPVIEQPGRTERTHFVHRVFAERAGEDLNADEVLTQLREWGHEVTGVDPANTLRTLMGRMVSQGQLVRTRRGLYRLGETP